MQVDALQLVQFISAKFYHDLAGEIGAVMNGASFANHHDPQVCYKAIELVQNGSKQLSARLKFYRQVYGYTKVNTQANLEELKEVTEQYLESTKIKLKFEKKFVYNQNVDINISKLLMCIIIFAQESLIYGGEIIIEVYKKEIILQAIGQNAKLDTGKYNILIGKTTNYPISTSNVHAYYTNILREETKAEVKFHVNEDRIQYIIVLPE